MTQLPLLSVIVPTHNRSRILAQHLLALSRQTWLAEDFEVIVVADACEDDTEEVVSALSSQLPYRLHFVSHAARSASATRNLGATLAQGQYYLFLDDDVLAEPGLITAHLQARGDNRVVMGFSRPVLPTRPSFWQYNARLWWEDVFREMGRSGHRFSYRDFFSGNVSMSAAIFHKVGGFDTTIRVRLEDYELGFRLLSAGAEFAFVPQAVGYHYDQTDLPVWLQRVYKEGIADIQIGQRHPETRHIQFADFDDVRGEWSRVKRWIRKLSFSQAQRRDRVTSVGLTLSQACERLHLRGPWLHLTGALREYNYWRGVAQQIGGYSAMIAYMQEAPVAPSVATDAPLIQMDQPESFDERQAKLDLAQRTGLRVAWQGLEIFSIPPMPGYESLRYEHIQAMMWQATKYRLIPAMAISLIQSKELDFSVWQFN